MGFHAAAQERLGRLPGELISRLDALPRRPVWIQAVSVGEVFLARTLIGRLQRAADLPVVLSSTTAAGRDAAAGLALPSLRGVFHFPIGSPFARRTLDSVRPCCLVLIETEIWPGLLRHCARRGLPALIVNGRISEKSRRNYRLIGPVLRGALGAVRLACMQTGPDAERAVAIGMAPERVVVTGNMKFDAPVPPEAPFDPRGLFKLPARTPILVAGSTSRGEEEAVLEAAEKTGVFTILAPRHPDRFEEVAALMTRRGLPHVRRSGTVTGDGAGTPRALLLDTVGELAGCYRAADLAFVGGSLVPRGGQNMIEPAACGVPVLFGPHTRNFAAIARALIDMGAGFRVDGAASLASAIRRLLDDEPSRLRAGRAGAGLVEENRGATDETIRRILPYLSPAGRGDGV